MMLLPLLLVACSPGLKLDWNLEVGDYSPVPAVSGRGALITSTYDTFSTSGAIKAHDPDDGSDLWRIERAHSDNRALTLDGDDNVVVRDDDALLGLDAETGEEAWRADGLGGVAAVAVDADLGRVYALQNTWGAMAATLSAVEDGEVTWSATVEDYASLLAVGADGAVFVTGSTAWAFEPDGSSRWSAPLASSAQTLCLDRDKLLVGLLNDGISPGGLAALDRHDGSTLWLSEHAPYWEPVVDDDGTIYMATGAQLVAIDGGSGETLWLGHEMHREVAVGGDGRLYGMGYLPEDPEVPELGWDIQFTVTDASSGEILWYEWQNDALDSVNGAPSFDGRRVYFAGGNFRAHMYAYTGGPGLGRGPWPRTNADNANRRKEQD
jgi:outer membrane protein assembly factor BamB